jgi:hypothetical protein
VKPNLYEWKSCKFLYNAPTNSFPAQFKTPPTDANQKLEVLKEDAKNPKW